MAKRELPEFEMPVLPIPFDRRWPTVPSPAEASRGVRALEGLFQHGVKLLDPDARAADERRRRLADSKALQAGSVSARALHDHYALKVDEIAFELPSLP